MSKSVFIVNNKDTVLSLLLTLNRFSPRFITLNYDFEYVFDSWKELRKSLV